MLTCRPKKVKNIPQLRADCSDLLENAPGRLLICRLSVDSGGQAEPAATPLQRRRQGLDRQARQPGKQRAAGRCGEAR
jgi:hypothetical protein